VGLTFKAFITISISSFFHLLRKFLTSKTFLGLFLLSEMLQRV